MARPAVALFSSPPGETLKARPGALAALRSDRPEDWTLEQQTSSEVFARDMRQTDEDHVGPWPPLALWGGSGWGGIAKFLVQCKIGARPFSKRREREEGAGTHQTIGAGMSIRVLFLCGGRRVKRFHLAELIAEASQKIETERAAGAGYWPGEVV